MNRLNISLAAVSLASFLLVGAGCNDNAQQMDQLKKHSIDLQTQVNKLDQLGNIGFQKQCEFSADTLFAKLGFDASKKPGELGNGTHTDHYNKKLDTCFTVITSVTNSGGTEVRAKSILEVSKQTNYGVYSGETTLKGSANPDQCTIYTNADLTKPATCGSEEEFDAYTKGLMSE